VTRGRVIARDGEEAVVRCEQFDITVTHAPAGWRVGHFVELESGTIITDCAAPGDYPTPGSEVMRMPRKRMALVRARAKVLAQTRAFFESRGFLEVETPLLVPSPGLEIHLEAVRAGDGYLITSPEYQMKRLLAAGFERIVQICKCFRGNEHGPHHSSEFTMIEWYRAHASLDAIIDDTEQLVATVCDGTARVGDRKIDVTPPWTRLTVREAMQRWAGVDIDRMVVDGAWDDAFFSIFLDKVEPQLAAQESATILVDWPAPLAALARRKPDDPSTALRFEAYIGGIELANAFDELTDPVEQRARFGDDQRIRAERGKPVYPLDEKLLAALAEGLPPSAGIALGFDRLVMLATGATSIDQVLTFTSAEL
jgi:elongation factor P--(R)-beta-lysine ligase